MAGKGLSVEIEADLKQLEDELARLRIFYEQYFSGVRNRAPAELMAKVQRAIVRFTNDPPRNTGQKFHFNQTNAKFQTYRQMWGRILREIENGTYRAHRFRAKLRSPDAPPAPADAPRNQGAEGVDQLARALSDARSKTGESQISEEKLAAVVQKQTEALQKKYAGADVSFKVVVEDGRAKLKAKVSR